MDSALARVTRCNDLIGRLENYDKHKNPRIPATPGNDKNFLHILRPSTLYLLQVLYIRCLITLEEKLKAVEAGYEELAALQAMVSVKGRD